MFMVLMGLDAAAKFRRNCEKPQTLWKNKNHKHRKKTKKNKNNKTHKKHNSQRVLVGSPAPKSSGLFFFLEVFYQFHIFRVFGFKSVGVFLAKNRPMVPA